MVTLSTHPRKICWVSYLREKSYFLNQNCNFLSEGLVLVPTITFSNDFLSLNYFSNDFLSLNYLKNILMMKNRR